MVRRLSAVLCLTLALPTMVSAQEHSDDASHSTSAAVDFITPHITDGDYIELPYWKAPFHTYVSLPKWEPVHVGPLTIDFSPT
ncbi:MAG: hypothetical protein MUD17_13810, partial [Gemmatimonadaceae bacterium]|nr:hypothetical protein [Gemmatimonadaceae bacterium]